MFVKDFDILRLWPIHADKQDNQMPLGGKVVSFTNVHCWCVGVELVSQVCCDNSFDDVPRPQIIALHRLCMMLFIVNYTEYIEYIETYAKRYA